MFQKGQKVHLIGIKGVFMTALAGILKEKGLHVTGSDGPAKFFTDKVLVKHGIVFNEQFASENIPQDVDLVISSAAYYFNNQAITNNPEVLEALRRAQGKTGRKVPLINHPQALKMLAEEYKLIAVTGSNGKSTTTALLGWVLNQAGVDPTVFVGTRVNSWDSNSKVGKSEWFVCESDEYREYFLNYKPFGAIITNIDYDHPDYYKTPAQYIEAFKKFANQILAEGFLIGCGDDNEVKNILESAKKRGVKTYSYGFDKQNEFYISKEWIAHPRTRAPKARYRAGQQCFTLENSEKKYELTIPFPGRQYVLNAVAAFIASQHLGVSQEKIIQGIATFPGTARRLEILKQESNCIIIDDYAHHPTAISVTLAGIKSMYPDKKIVALFQPHMFSRTQALLSEFSTSFSSADVVGIMEIYPSARESSGPVNGKDLAEATKKKHRDVTYLKNETEAKQFIATHQKPGTVIVLMGAGNVNDLV